MKIRSLLVDEIVVGPRHRPLSDEAVDRMVESISRVGLLTPITVHTSASDDDPFWLVAGHHRLAAIRKLGWDTVDVFEVSGDDVEIELREIAENLHRENLTALERSDHIARWIELTEVSDRLSETPNKGGRPGKAAAAAKEIGVNERDAQRAIQVALLSPEAKAAAVKHGLDKNRSALLEAAKEKEPAAQVAKIDALAKAKKAKKRKNIREDKERARNVALLTESYASSGLLTPKQIADYRERGIVPAVRLFTTCGMAFDDGPDRETTRQMIARGEEVVMPTPPSNEFLKLQKKKILLSPEERAEKLRSSVTMEADIRRKAILNFDTPAKIVERTKKKPRASVTETKIDKMEPAETSKWDDSDIDYSDCDTPEEIAERGFLYRASEAAAMAHYDLADLEITDEIIRSAVDAADSWKQLVDKLKANKRISAAA
jgi:ParB/RepB/Spo0J family partition protein